MIVAPGRFGGLPLAEEIALCIVDLADERLDGIKRRLPPPRRDEPDRLVEPAAAAKIDRLRRFRQQNVDVGAHPVDPRDLVGIVGDKRPEPLQLFRGRRSRSLIGAEKRVRSRQQIAALGQLQRLHRAEQLGGCGLDFERVGDPAGRRPDALDHRRGEEAGDHNQDEACEREQVGRRAGRGSARRS